MLLRCLDSNAPPFLSSSLPSHLLLLNSPFPFSISHCTPFPSLSLPFSLPFPHTRPFRAGSLIPEGSGGTETVGRDPGVSPCSAAASCPQKPPGLPPLLLHTRCSLGLPRAHSHHVPSEITWRHRRPPLPLGPQPRSRHSPLQTACRTSPLPTWVSTVRRASSVIPTKGMHRRAAEEAGTEGPRGSVRDTGDWGPSLPGLGLLGHAGRAGGRGTGCLPQGGSPLGKWGGRCRAKTPRVCLQQVPTLWELASG